MGEELVELSNQRSINSYIHLCDYMIFWNFIDFKYFDRSISMAGKSLLDSNHPSVVRFTKQQASYIEMDTEHANDACQ